jgi:hypothetical protein
MLHQQYIWLVLRDTKRGLFKILFFAKKRVVIGSEAGMEIDVDCLSNCR